MASKSRGVLRRLDAVVDGFVNRCRFFNEPMTVGRAEMFAMPHRLNARQRDSVPKLSKAWHPLRVSSLGR